MYSYISSFLTHAMIYTAVIQLLQSYELYDFDIINSIGNYRHAATRYNTHNLIVKRFPNEDNT